MHAHARFLGHILRVWPHTSAQRREHNATQLQQAPQQSDARTHHSSNPRSRSLRHVPAVCPSQRSYCAFQAGAGTEQGWHGPFADASWRVTRRSAPLERPWSPMLACVSARKTNCIACLRLARNGTDTPAAHRTIACTRSIGCFGKCSWASERGSSRSWSTGSFNTGSAASCANHDGQFVTRTHKHHGSCEAQSSSYHSHGCLLSLPIEYTRAEGAAAENTGRISACAAWGWADGTHHNFVMMLDTSESASPGRPMLIHNSITVLCQSGSVVRA